MKIRNTFMAAAVATLATAAAVVAPGASATVEQRAGSPVVAIVAPPLTAEKPRAQAAAKLDRKPLKRPVTAPDKPKASQDRKPSARPSTAPSAVRISGYRTCNRTPQRCIDAGSLTLYGQPYGVNILAGHNYQGYQWLSRVLVGKRVVVASGPVAGTYVVTGHMRLNRQGGNLPGFGGADLVLQSCEGSGTGFSLLRRI